MGYTGNPYQFYYQIPRPVFEHIASGMISWDLILGALAVLTGFVALRVYATRFAGLDRKAYYRTPRPWSSAHLAAGILFWLLRIILFYFLLVDFRTVLSLTTLGNFFVFMIAAILLILAFILGLVVRYHSYGPLWTTRLLWSHVGLSLFSTLLAFVSLIPLDLAMHS